MANIDTYLKAVGLGVIAGSRSMSAPALLTHHLAKSEPRALASTPLGVFSSSWVATLLRLAAAGEMVADKIPGIPARIEIQPLAGRVVFGALSGLLICVAANKPAAVGALLGGLGALAGAFGFYHLRRLIGEETAIPDPLLGAAEDAIVIGGGLALLDNR
ncbi:MAG: DUF4126 family protein [Chloroflexota bacterium]|nr:DUF4126 family protein [Chloroflexota bacterium]